MSKFIFLWAIIATTGLACGSLSDPVNTALTSAVTGSDTPVAEQARTPESVTVFPELALGNGHSCFLRVNGTVKCFGRNHNGQLGLGDQIDRGRSPLHMGGNLPNVMLGSGFYATAITAGYEHTCTLLNSKDVKCWGRNFEGQLGLSDRRNRGGGPNEMGEHLPRMDLGGQPVSSVSAGYFHTCVSLENGRVRCFGSNDRGQLGYDDHLRANVDDASRYVNLGSDAFAIKVYAGANHTCALLRNGKVKCWGGNRAGQLGTGDKLDRGIDPMGMGDALPAFSFPAAIRVQSLALGESHTCGLIGYGDVRCVGANNLGQLGDPSKGAGGATELAGIVDFGRRYSATSISASADHTCVVLDNGHVKCWGSNRAGCSFGGQLGRDEDCTPGGTCIGTCGSEMGDALLPVSIGNARGVKLVACGWAHTGVLIGTRDSLPGTWETKFWGLNRYGQLGVGRDVDQSDVIGTVASLPLVDTGPL